MPATNLLFSDATSEGGVMLPEDDGGVMLLASEGGVMLLNR